MNKILVAGAAGAIMAIALMITGLAVADTKSTRKNIDDLNQKIATTTDRDRLANLYAYRAGEYSDLHEYAKTIDDYTLALDIWNNMFNRDFEVAMSHYRRGGAYSKLQASDKAIQDFDSAIRTWPTDQKPERLANVFYSRAVVRDRGFKPVGQKSIFQQTNSDSLLEHKMITDDLTMALKLWPDNNPFYLRPAAFALRAKHYTLSNQRKLALIDYNASLTLFPSPQTEAERDSLIRDMIANGEAFEAPAPDDGTIPKE